MSETFVFVMGGKEFNVSFRVTDNDNDNLRMAVTELVEQIKGLLTRAEKNILNGRAAMGVQDDSSKVTIKLKCLTPNRTYFVDSFQDLKDKRSLFEDAKIKSALYFDFAIDYPTKFKVDTGVMEYYQPTRNITTVYYIRLLAGNRIRFFPQTDTLVGTNSQDNDKPFWRNTKYFLRWSILSPRPSSASYAKEKNEVYNSIVYAWNRVKYNRRGLYQDFGSQLFIEQMGEIQKLMKEKDQEMFQDKEITVLRRVKKLEDIFNDRVFDILSKDFEDPNEREKFLRRIDQYLSNIHYDEKYEKTGSLRAEIEDIERHMKLRNPSTPVRDSTAATTSSSPISSSGKKRFIQLDVAPSDLYNASSPNIMITDKGYARVWAVVGTLDELKTTIKRDLNIEADKEIEISKAVSDGDPKPEPFTTLDEIQDKQMIQIHRSVQGGYRETPKRKKRRDTRRKKRKNTRRKNTKRKNTKRKNTKRRNTKKR